VVELQRREFHFGQQLQLKETWAMNFEVNSNPAIQAAETDRVAFIKQTYLHLAGAILAFAALEAVIQMSGIAAVLTSFMVGRWSWLIVMAAFMGVSHLATNWASSDSSSSGKQYLGLGLYVIAEAIIFAPLLLIASYRTSGNVIPTAGVLTLFLFSGLTASVFISKKDLSWMGRFLTIGGFIALGIIVASAIFGFSLGLIFSAVMIIFAGASIMYQTSNIMNHYQTNQHVAASLALFASVALLFWYLVRFFSSSRN
jgi:FtsH-binding integral membrane protein